ncbi:MAG: hypothetical protein LBP73_06550 [Clostridiales Family XIII bacterium]|jgi:accessory gene regulator protein AgrB|nr:hypothetical protein [Clostridiales Family XIII bacterium]
MAERNEFLAKELTELERKKGKIAGYLALLVILIGLLLGFAFYKGMTALPIFLAIINILFGPVTLFFYFREVRKGIFKADQENE